VYVTVKFGPGVVYSGRNNEVNVLCYLDFRLMGFDILLPVERVEHSGGTAASFLTLLRRRCGRLVPEKHWHLSTIHLRRA
jgi:hypothetical protein